jgi:UPF0755 protein
VKKVLLALLVFGVLVGVGMGTEYLWREWRVTAFATTPITLLVPVLVEIPPGSGSKTVARLLEEAGVITDAGLLDVYIRRKGLVTKLQAGEYEFAETVTPEQVVEKIRLGRVKVYRFTIPEGLRAEEILPIVARSLPKLDLGKLEQLASKAGFLAEIGVPAGFIEGFLFPDTYLFTSRATEEFVLTKMVSRALEEYRRADVQRKEGVTLDVLETFTLASIVEKETGVVEERPHISCVFHNRLARGMRLETDPTVLYSMRLRGVKSNNITRKDLRTEHPYNTYKVTGLPPGPIASPGAAALEAALHPQDCEDLFFVSRNDGTHIFCPTRECHEAAVKEWQVEYFRRKRELSGEQ